MRGRIEPFWTLAAALLGTLLTASPLRAQDSTAEETHESFFRKLHLSGNADLLFLYGERNSSSPGANFKIENARLFLDVDLGENLHLGDSLLVRDLSFYVEWDLAREAMLQNTVGSLYVRFDELGGVDALHLKVGRFLIPFGEEYLRASESRPENPLMSFSVADPYGWDEGVLLFGPLFGGTIEYYLAVTNGDFGFDVNTSPDLLVSGKLDWNAFPWLLFSGSVLYMGRSGNATHPAVGSVEWSGNNPRSFGASSSVPNYQNGIVVADDPDARLGGTLAWEGDIVLKSPLLGRLRLAVGAVTLRSRDLSSYDRMLRYEIVEAVLEARVLFPELNRLYLAARYSRIGTETSEKGYLLGDYGGGSPLGYNTRSLTQVGLGLGYRLATGVVVKGEYSLVAVRLVRGVPPPLGSYALGQNVVLVGVSLAF